MQCLAKTKRSGATFYGLQFATVTYLMLDQRAGMLIIGNSTNAFESGLYTHNDKYNLFIQKLTTLAHSANVQLQFKQQVLGVPVAIAVKPSKPDPSIAKDNGQCASKTPLLIL